MTTQLTTRAKEIRDSFSQNETYQSMFDKVERAIDEVEQLAADVASATLPGKPIPASQQRKLDNLTAELGQLKTIRKRLDDECDEKGLVNGEERYYTRAGMTEEYRQVTENSHVTIPDPRPAGSDGSTRGQGSEQRSAACRRVEGMKDLPTRAADNLMDAVESDSTDRTARLVLAGSDPAYVRAFSKLLRDPQNGHRSFDDEELAAFQRAEQTQRALAIGSGSTGGYLVPTMLDPAVILSNDGVIDPIRGLARNVTISTDTWNGVSSAGVTAEWHTEGAAVADASPTFAQPSIDVHTADAFVPFSVESGMDAENLLNSLRELLRDAKASHEAAAWLTGSGSGQPTGILTALPASSEVSPATAETFAAEDVYATLEAVPPRWRPNATWGAALGTINAMAQFETSNGARLFPTLDATPPTLLRRTLAEISGMDSSTAIDGGADGTNKVLLVGDFRQYVIVDRIGTTIELIPHLFDGDGFPRMQRGLLMYWRTGADVVVDDAFRVLSIPTTK